MAVTYESRKCDCGGKLEFDARRKVWVCKYCGNEIERVLQSDIGINNHVRQTLLNIAYRKMENASKDLEECERMDPRYIGTVIANLAYLLVQATICANGDEVKAIFAKAKRYNGILQEYPGITEDEAELYEFCGGDTSDIYATLVLVYDTLNDTRRRDYVQALLNPEDIYALETNKGLISYALKNGQSGIADKIIRNAGHIDKRHALNEILLKYPDGEGKTGNIESLFQADAFSPGDAKLVSEYFSLSKDSVDTKAAVFKAAAEKGIKTSIDNVLSDIIAKAQDADEARRIFEAVNRQKLTDEEIEKYISYCLSPQCRPDIAVCGLNALLSSEQFVLLNQRWAIQFLDTKAQNAEDKINLAKSLFAFKAEARTMESISNYYLCSNSCDDWPIREKIIQLLFEKSPSLPVNAVEGYVLKCAVDGENKPEIVKRIFNLNLNLNYFSGLLGQYLFSAADREPARGRIIDILISKQFKIDSNTFGRYVCSDWDTGEVKRSRILLLLKNGSRIGNDIINQYLTGMRDYSKYDPLLLKMFIADNCVVSNEAIAAYTLYCMEPGTKHTTLESLMKKDPGNLQECLCSVKHLQNEISCNLLQAYILVCRESFDDAHVIAEILAGTKMKLNADIRANGVSQKFKKYIVDNKPAISSVTNALCEAYKVYTMLF